MYSTPVLHTKYAEASIDWGFLRFKIGMLQLNYEKSTTKRQPYLDYY